MHRKIWGLAGVAILVSLTSGCCNPDRPGLFARLRNRCCPPEKAQCVPCANTVAVPGMDPGLPPGAILPGAAMPGGPMMPGAASCPCQNGAPRVIEGHPELIMPQQTPGSLNPMPTRPTPNPAAPGNATPNAAPPSGDKTGLRKGELPPVTKPLISP